MTGQIEFVPSQPNAPRFLPERMFVEEYIGLVAELHDIREARLDSYLHDGLVKRLGAEKYLADGAYCLPVRVSSEVKRVRLVRVVR